jgi:hypothetical protein
MLLDQPPGVEPLVISQVDSISIQGIWARVELSSLINSVCWELVHMHASTVDVASSQHQYQVKEMVRFLDFTIHLLRDLHRPLAQRLHRHMMVQLSNLNARVYHVDVDRYSTLGAALCASLHEQLGRDYFNVQAELVWTTFYVRVAQMMAAVARDPVMESPTCHLRKVIASRSGGLTDRFRDSVGDISTVTAPSRLSLVDDAASDISPASSTIYEDYEAFHTKECTVEPVATMDCEDIESSDENSDDDDDTFGYLNAFSDLDTSATKKSKLRSSQDLVAAGSASTATLRQSTSHQPLYSTSAGMTSARRLSLSRTTSKMSSIPARRRSAKSGTDCSIV